MSIDTLKPIPYGDGDFVSVRTSGCAYVDKTAFIEKMEQDRIKHPFIVRPRRFGKTLFTSMLKAYYDAYASKDFDRLFKGTYIATHKTMFASQYRVLRLDFSGLATKNIAFSFCNKLRVCCEEFASRYPSHALSEFFSRDYAEPADFITAFLGAAREGYDKKIYVVIDEYDQFANELLSSDVQSFRQITSSNGFLKEFYAALKSESVDGIIAHVFITGVTTISMDSMSSEFNIRKDISSLPKYADMFGFSDAELKSLIFQVVDLKQCQHTADEIFARMKQLYDGYRCSPVSSLTVFNPSMSLYYLDAIRNTNEEPRQILDPAFSPDLSKVNGLLSLGDEAISKIIVEQALKHQPIFVGVPSTVINLNSVNKLGQKDLLTSLLCMGFLTYSDKDQNALIVPNLAVLQQFFGYYLSYLNGWVETGEVASSEFKYGFEKLKSGDPKPLFEGLCRGFNSSSGIYKSLHLKKSDFQTLVQATMFFCKDYDTKAEVEVGGCAEKGYADLILNAMDQKDVSYIIELKYLTKRAATKRNLNKTLQQALLQAQSYALDAKLSVIPNVKCLAVVFIGTGQFELLLADPKIQS